MKDSASFLGVRFAADGLKLDTTALGLRTMVFGLRLLLITFHLLTKLLIKSCSHVEMVWYEAENNSFSHILHALVGPVASCFAK